MAAPSGRARVAAAALARMQSGRDGTMTTNTADSAGVRDAEETEVVALARLWLDGWRDAHAHLAPAELTRLRTLESFEQRLRAALADIRVVGRRGAPLGFCITKHDELYQLYVAAPARGSGVADVLISDAERRLVERGITCAWLSCAIGNDRAARFYAKRGWRRVGTMVYDADTATGPFPLEVWRFEKALPA
jgi:ribosomal protein S18 acetylase RimI-like enzyme